MFTYDTKYAPVTDILLPLDAKELLMLYGMMERAQSRTHIAMSIGLLDGLLGGKALQDYIDIGFRAYDGCMRRVSSISETYEYFAWMPSRSDWKRELEADTSF